MATRCTNVEQFVATFHRFCDDSTFFVATLATRPVGLETAFSIQLEDKTPVLRGLCSVVEAWATPANRFGRPGVRLAVKRLTNESLVVFRQLQTARKAAEAAEAAGLTAAPVVSGQSAVVEITPPIATAIIPSSPDTAAAFATLGLTALAPKRVDQTTLGHAGGEPAPAESTVIGAKAFDDGAATDGAATAPATTPPTADIPSAAKSVETRPIESRPAVTTPTAGLPIAAKSGETKPAESRTSTATPPAGLSTAPSAKVTPPKLPPLRPVPYATPPAFPVFPSPTGAPTPLPSVRADATPMPTPAPSAPPTPAVSPRTDAPPIPSSARPRSDATPPPRPPAKAMNPALADSPPPRDYVPEPIAASDDLTNPVATETRTPGSSFVLPANPLMNLTDKSLEGFVDCALYEETGNVFRAPEYEDSLVDIDDVLASPPQPARPAPRTLSPLAALRPNAFIPSEPNQDFSPEATPLPYLAGIVPHRAETDPPIPPTPPAGRAPTPPVFDESAGMFHGHGYEETAAGQRPPPDERPPHMPMAMQPMYPAQPPYASPPQHAAPLDSTASMLALDRQRDRKRWLVIGGAAAGTSLLLLIIVLATSGGGRNKSADAATTDPVAQTPEKMPAIAKTPEKTPEVAKAPQPPPEDPPDEPGGDPDAPPVVGSGPCRVTVNSSPAGSIVSIDDQQIGPSPITIAGPCTKRKVDVKHPRYALGTKWVSLSEGKPANVDLALARPTHSVTVTSTPSGATVSIAGRRAGTTPTQVKVMGFTGVTLTVEKKGFKTVTQKLYSKLDGERLGVVLVRGR